MFWLVCIMASLICSMEFLNFESTYFFQVVDLINFQVMGVDVMVLVPTPLPKKFGLLFPLVNTIYILHNAEGPSIRGCISRIFSL